MNAIVQKSSFEGFPICIALGGPNDTGVSPPYGGMPVLVPFDTPLNAAARGGQHTAPVIPIPGAGGGTVYRALAKLRQYSQLSQNWDGLGACAPDDDSFGCAENFLAVLSSWKRPFAFDAQIFSSGTAVLTVTGYGLDAQFEFLPNGTIAAIVDVDGQEWDDDVAGFDGKRLPAAISDRLSHLK